MTRDVLDEPTAPDAPDPRPAPSDLEHLRRFINSDNRYFGVDYLIDPDQRAGYFERTLPQFETEDITAQGWGRLIALRNQVRAVVAGDDDLARDRLTATARTYPVVLAFGSTGTTGAATVEPARRSSETVIAVSILEALHRAASDGRLERLRLCARPDCGWCYYDTSKNHSGRWCSSDPCGGVMKARAYRARNRADGH